MEKASIQTFIEDFFGASGIPVEKIEIVDEIGKKNPQLRQDLFKNIFLPNTNILSNIIPYLVILLIIYIILKK